MPAQSVLIGWYQILTEIKQQSHQSEPSSISLQNMLLKPDGRHQNQIDYILCSQRWRSSIQSAKTRQGADCGSDHELLIAKFRLKLKKVEKTTRPFSSVQVSSVAQLCSRSQIRACSSASALWRLFSQDGAPWAECVRVRRLPARAPLCLACGGAQRRPCPSALPRRGA